MSKKGMAIPADAATQVWAMVGRRGSGKTYGAGKLVEHLVLAGNRVIVLDPVGVWWGLRLRADGAAGGFGIPIIGGQQADLELDPSPAGAAALATTLVDLNKSAIIDMSTMRASFVPGFVAAFCEELLEAKKKNRSALCVVMEEAQIFAPQRLKAGKSQDALDAVEMLIKLGRNYGVGAMLITQRPQAVHKDVLNQTEALFCYQLTGKEERAAIREWIREKDVPTKFDLADEIPGLEVGTAIVWSPSWLKYFGKLRLPPKLTFDSSKTPDGSQVALPALPPIEIAPELAAACNGEARPEGRVERFVASLNRAELEKLKKLVHVGDTNAAPTSAAASDAFIIP